MAWDDIPDWSLEAAKGLLDTVKEVDSFTFFHCCRVGRGSRKLAKAIGLNEFEQAILEYSGLFHDIGKPKTRSIGPDGVAFHHHELVGARMTRKRMVELHYASDDIDDVVRLVELHLRFHGYDTHWTDSAVRRYVRDAGPLLWRLNQLTRADCTTRNQKKAEDLANRMDALESRIEELRAKEELDSIRPDLDGNEVMEILGVSPGREVGNALKFLLEIRLEDGPIGKEEATKRLLAWHAEQNV